MLSYDNNMCNMHVDEVGPHALSTARVQSRDRECDTATSLL